MSTGKNLPSSLELLWGTTDRPSRGPKPTLSVDKIVRTAIAIADADGLDAVSMQRVAGDLGYTTMSLYRYIPSKEQLIEVMLDTATETPPESAAPGAHWRTEIEAWVQRVWDVYQRHPWMVRVQISGPPAGPNNLAALEAVLRPLSRAGLDGVELISTAVFLLGVIRELARTSLDISNAQEQAGITATEAEEGFATVLRTYLDNEHFPILAKLVSNGVFDPAGAPEDGGLGLDLNFGVQRLLDGIESYTRSRRSDPTH